MKKEPTARVSEDNQKTTLHITESERHLLDLIQYNSQFYSNQAKRDILRDGVFYVALAEGIADELPDYRQNATSRFQFRWQGNDIDNL